MTEIRTSEGVVEIEPLPNSMFRYNLKDLSKGIDVEATTFESCYGQEVAQAILDMEGIDRLVRELLREEGSFSSQNFLRYYTLGYLPEEDFVGKRMLDFGCGCGASTMALAKILPESFVVGLDRMEDCINVCNLKKAQLGIDKVSFIASTEDTRLPDSLGQVDFCIMCAVYEHLLPSERRPLLHDIWSRLAIGGVLFIVQTPHRHAPLGTHGARVPLLNYLPDSMAFKLDRWFDRETHGKFTDEEILRAGFRGGSKREVQRILQQTGHEMRFLNPNRLGMRDSIDLWILTRDLSNFGTLKRIYGSLCRNFKAVTGLTIEPYLNLAIQKT